MTDSQRFCKWCGKPYTTGAFCGHCGKPIGSVTNHDAELLPEGMTPSQQLPFSSADREIPAAAAQELAASAQVAQPAAPLPQRRRKSPILWLVAVIGILLILSGSAYAYVVQPFATAKELLLAELDKEGRSGAVQTAGMQISFSLTLQDLDPKAREEEVEWLYSLQGQPIGVDVTVLPGKHQAQMHVSASYKQAPISADVFIGDNRIILAAASVDPILAEISQGEAPKIPQYLVIDDPGVTARLKEFWNSLDRAQTSQQQGASKSARDLVRLILEATPDKYLSRPHLNQVELSLDQDGLRDLLKSVIAAAYRQPERVADDVSALVAQSNPEIQQAKFRAEVLDELTHGRSSDALNQIDRAFDNGAVHLDHFSLVMEQPLFGSPRVTTSGTIAANQDHQRVLGRLKFQYEARGTNTATIAWPTLDKNNSMTLQQFIHSPGKR